jgi:hypothetical protein
MRILPYVLLTGSVVVGLVIIGLIVSMLNPKEFLTVLDIRYPELKVGSCYERLKELEEWEKAERDIIKVVKRGKTKYGFYFWYPEMSKYIKSIAGMNFNIVERLYNKEVPCPKDGEYYEEEDVK